MFSVVTPCRTKFCICKGVRTRLLPVPPYRVVSSISCYQNYRYFKTVVDSLIFYQLIIFCSCAQPQHKCIARSKQSFVVHLFHCGKINDAMRFCTSFLMVYRCLQLVVNYVHHFRIHSLYK